MTEAFTDGLLANSRNTAASGFANNFMTLTVSVRIRTSTAPMPSFVQVTSHRLKSFPLLDLVAMKTTECVCYPDTDAGTQIRNPPSINEKVCRSRKRQIYRQFVLTAVPAQRTACYLFNKRFDLEA